MLRLILPQAIFLCSMFIAWEVLPTCTKALWSNQTICSFVGFASGLIRSDHRQVRGPVTSSNCSWSLYRVFSAPKCGSLPFLESCSSTSGSSLGACSALRFGKVCKDGSAFLIFQAFIKMFVKKFSHRSKWFPQLLVVNLWIELVETP